MMVSPNYMKSEYEKLSYEELVEVREELLASIRAFEENKDGAREYQVCPSPAVVYHSNLEYLGQLASVMAEKFSELTWKDED